MLGTIAAIWGFCGIIMLFSSAIYRLGALALDMPVHSFSWYHWVALVACVLFMGFAEGYRGFQQNFSPRVAARLLYLQRNVTPARLIFAPFFGMGYFHATRKRQIISICLTAGIVVLVLIVRQIEQPWRGIIDCGVVLGLAWGIVSLAAFTFRAFSRPGYSVSPETP
ncbi:hypothetical protein [Marinobacterium mangrovicola]|uniref:Uncharacterized protein n=1 Tax=Marinobacterium mangrovicola TaxID=1476959 RepID=A0A4R1GDC5_9GAMM|nr:hypothetical protein [Marinobacterium mangrovicola]TCK06084.1 hypothetical protein CLV83_3033 [Marinobacterium mangrovicola]